MHRRISTNWFVFLLGLFLASCSSAGSVAVEDAEADLHNVADVPEIEPQDITSPDTTDTTILETLDNNPQWPETMQCLADDDCLFLDDTENCLVGRCSDALLCTQVTASNGTFCNGGCIQTGFCNEGICQSETEIDCDDMDPCTEDTCESGECAHSPLSEGSCDDDNACTDTDTCIEGACVGENIACNDGNPCTIDSCDTMAGCVALETDGECDDEDPCTLDDTCLDGVCTGTPGGCPLNPWACHIRCVDLATPGFCDLGAELNCDTATAVVQQLLLSGCDGESDPFISLLLAFELYSPYGDEQSISGGQATCNQGGTECSILDTAVILNGAWDALPCQEGSACFSASAPSLDLVLLGLAVPLYDVTIAGSVTPPMAPNGIAGGTATAFLRENTAQALNVQLPTMSQSVPLSEILDPSSKLEQNGTLGWVVSMAFDCARVDWNPSLDCARVDQNPSN